MTIDANKRYEATLETSLGTIVVEMLSKEAPRTVNNFVFLARDGFYDGTRFHRVIKGFMFQGGDPLGNGTGGPGYRFNDEPITRDYTPGIMAMANSGANTNGSQFFIMHGTAALPKAYVIFGQVIQGQDVVDKIASVQVGPGNPGELSRPVQDVLLKKVTIAESGP